MTNRVLKLAGWVSLFEGIMSLVALGTSPLPTGRVTLAWDPSSDPTVVGYRLYEGLASGDYTTVIDVGNATTVTISNLTLGATYYFAVTDYDANGMESPFSSEISCTVPFQSANSVKLLLSAAAPRQMQLTAAAPPGYTYTVEATSDLRNWTSVGSATADVTGLVQFIDTAATNATRFYRLLQTSP